MVDFVEPVSGRTAYSTFVEDLTPTYATADAAYEAWCAALGVGTLDTEYTVSAEHNLPDFIELDFEPVDGSISRWITLAQGGGLGLYEADPSSFAGSLSSNPAGSTFRLFFLPTSVPFLLIGGQSTDTGNYHQHYDLKLHKTATECIMIYSNTKQDASGVNVIRNAFRITPGFLEWYGTKGVAFDSGITAAFRYAIFNYLTNAYTSAATVYSDFTGTINFASIDLGELRAHAHEFVGFDPDVPVGWDANGVTADTVSLASVVYPAYGLLLAQTTGFAPVAARTWRPGYVVEEIVGLLADVDPNGAYGVTAADAVRLTDLLNTTFPITIAQGVGVAPVAAAARAILVLEALGIADTLTPNASFGLSLAQSLGLSDSLRNLFGGELSDGIGIAPALGQLYRAGRIVSEGMGVAETMTPRLVIRVDVDEEIGLDPAEVINMIFSPVLLEPFEITAAFVSPDGGVTAWAVNTRNLAVSEYTNFAFNSFGRIGNRYLGATSAGLYELNGDTDDGESVISRIKSGLLQFNGTKLSGFSGAYIATRGEGSYILRMVAGDGRTYDYAVSTRDTRTTKIKFGKGLRARYFSFELISTGDDFDLDTLEFVPLWSQRHV